MDRTRYTTGLKFKWRSSRGSTPWNDGDRRFFDKETNWSLNHPGWRNPDGDVGGPWFYKRTNSYPIPVVVSTDYYRGPIWPEFSLDAADQPAIPWLGTLTLNSIGSTCISRVLPTNPASDMATFLGELITDRGVASLPGSITRERGISMRSAGGEYLNTEFGWIPFLSDLRSFASAIKNRNKIISGFVKGSDRKIRRRYVYSNPTSTTVTATRFADAPLITQNISSGFRTVLSHERIWFSGAFRYHVPLGDDFWSKALRWESFANHLLGTRVTPETVWNIAPWTWLGDWFGNTGDVLHNVSALGSDGLCMQYGYMMRSKTSEQTDVVSAGVMRGSSKVSVLEAKQRVDATPYGFGLTPASLSKRQVAVLAALGLSRGGVPWDQSISRKANPV